MKTSYLVYSDPIFGGDKGFRNRYTPIDFGYVDIVDEDSVNGVVRDRAMCGECVMVVPIDDPKTLAKYIHAGMALPRGK